MTTYSRAPVGLVTCLLLAVVGCSAPSDAAGRTAAATSATPYTSATPASAKKTGSPRTAATAEAVVPERSPSATPSQATRSPAQTRQQRRAALGVPALGLRDLPVVAYVGSPDDARGTRIQNRGVAASPRGPGGGVAPGEVGNYIVTAHRTSAGGPFRDLPALRTGAHILLTSGGSVYDYRVTGTRTTSFRSERSLARQSAAVPGHPGKRATRPMITLSTCATPEDHARGNYWADEFGNPEHRIDKIGVLVDVRPA